MNCNTKIKLLKLKVVKKVVKNCSYAQEYGNKDSWLTSSFIGTP